MLSLLTIKNRFKNISESGNQPDSESDIVQDKLTYPHPTPVTFWVDDFPNFSSGGIC